MKRWCCATLACCVTFGRSDAASDAGQVSAQASLNSEQQRAVGIAVAHPVAAKAPQRIEALGLVLDATALLSDLGDAAAAAAAEHATSAELARLHALHDGGAGASVKVLEAVQADQVRAQAQSELAAARLALHWGPVAGLTGGARQTVIDAAVSGRSLLLRADLPGRHALGARLNKAVLDVDGIEVPGRVLGTLRQATELQSVGLLIEVLNPPAGLGPGARIPVALLTAELSGLLLPRAALLYDENGAYVYKQLSKKTAADNSRYAAVRVNLLLPYGDEWLVEGVDDDDDIVVHGAGVLWSLKDAGSRAADDDDD